LLIEFSAGLLSAEATTVATATRTGKLTVRRLHDVDGNPPLPRLRRDK
jgi:hypothetical protein